MGDELATRVKIAWNSKPADTDSAKLAEAQLALRAMSALIGQGYYNSEDFKKMLETLGKMGVSGEVRRDMAEHFLMNRSKFVQDLMG